MNHRISGKSGKIEPFEDSHNTLLLLKIATGISSKKPKFVQHSLIGGNKSTLNVCKITQCPYWDFI